MPPIRLLSEQAKDYIARSLVPLLVLDNRLHASSPDHSGPLSMKFHKEWRHSDCPVHQWYRQRSSRSPTQLRSVQHWRDRKVPYHHEYLLLELADGAVCRLERLGVGSRSAAIGRVGCTAHDIIQHFPPQTYRDTMLAAEPSDLVVELATGGFDLLDVLAIGYAMQQYKRSSTYTVQRFDSHFLCITILTLLARRIANWEAQITQNAWHLMVTRTMQQLQNASGDAHAFFGLAVCPYINPDQPTPQAFVLRAIQNELNTDGGDSLRNEVAATLWNKDLKQAARDGFSNYVEGAVRHALNDTNPCAMRTKQLLGIRQEPGASDDLALAEFRRSIVTRQTAAWLSSMQTCATTMTTPYAMRVKEHSVPLMVLIRSSFCTPSLSLKALQHFGEIWEDLIPSSGPIVKVQTTMNALPQVIKMTHIRNVKNFMAEVPNNEDMIPVDESTSNNAMDSVISATYDVLQQHVATYDYSTRVLVVVNSWLNKKIWTRCLEVCVGKGVGEELNNTFRLARLSTIQSSRAGRRRQISVFEFMDEIQRRIQTHAGEMQTFGLAMATLVQSDIEEAMSEIWKLSPEEFGSGLDVAESIPDEQAPPYDPNPVGPENAA